MNKFWDYVDAVEGGEILSCEAIKLGVARFRSDLKASKRRGAKYHFDESRALKIIDFLEHLKHFEEPFTGKPIILEPWQCFWLGQLYGWRDSRTGSRRFRKFLQFVARKNGKTIIASGLALYEIFSKPGVEAYSLATKQIIANKAFKNIKLFVERNPDLKRRLEIRKSPAAIMNPANASTFVPLSSDSDLDGLNPAFVIMDELAAQENGEARARLTSGMGSRSEPLEVIISTASDSLDNPLIDEYGYARNILEGTVSDDSYLVAIYEIDKGDRWDDLSILEKANPNLNVSVHLDYFADELKKARLIPRRAVEYKTKYCNLWQSAADTWIPDSTWSRCRSNAKRNADKITPEALANATSYVAIDFSSIWDWTAMTRYYWIDELGKYYARHRFYIPGEKVDEKSNLENPALREWIEQGLVVATPGEKIDHSALYRDLEEELKKGRVTAIVYDPARARDFEMEFQARSTIVPFSQKTANMSPAAKAWEESIVAGEIMDDSPVLRWMVSCAINKQYSDTGRYSITKQGTGKYGKRIDGVITSIMAHAMTRAIVIKPRPKVMDLSKIRY